MTGPYATFVHVGASITPVPTRHQPSSGESTRFTCISPRPNLKRCDWTKAADEILDNLPGYRNTISDSRHYRLATNAEDARRMVDLTQLQHFQVCK